MKARHRILIFCLVCFAFIGCDKATKNLAKTHLMGKEPISFLQNTFRLEYAENTGAFLSFGADWPKTIGFWAFGVLPFILLSALFVYAINKLKQRTFLDMLPIAFIFSGGIGNISDRIVYDRHVVDFMNLGISGIRTGIFNFADVYVLTGIILIFYARYKKLPANEV